MEKEASSASSSKNHINTFSSSDNHHTWVSVRSALITLPILSHRVEKKARGESSKCSNGNKFYWLMKGILKWHLLSFSFVPICAVEKNAVTPTSVWDQGFHLCQDAGICIHHRFCVTSTNVHIVKKAEDIFMLLQNCFWHEWVLGIQKPIHWELLFRK